MFHFLSCLDNRNYFLSRFLFLWLPFNPVLHKLQWPFESINLIVSFLPRSLNRLLIALGKKTKQTSLIWPEDTALFDFWLLL